MIKDYQLIESDAELEDLTAEIRGTGVWAIDTETTGLDQHEDYIVGISVSTHPGSGYFIPTVDDMLPNLPDAVAGWFENAKAKNQVVVAHNWKFDLKMFHAWGISPVWDAFVFDTMIAARILNSTWPLNLENLAAIVLGVDGTKFSDVVEEEENFVDVPLETAANYAIEDTDLTLQLYDALHTPGRMTAINHEMRLVRETALMETAGFAFDSEEHERLIKEWKATLDSLDGKIVVVKKTEGAFNPQSSDQLSHELYDLRGMAEVGNRTPGGKRCTKGATIETLLKNYPSDDLLSLIVERKRLGKLLSTYGEKYRKHIREGRIFPSFRQMGAETGRFTSSDPNIQQIPQGNALRNLFTASPGMELVVADYKQIELVLLAALSGDHNMKRILGEGRDLHTETARFAFGLSPTETPTKKQRTVGKSINFGIPYGMGAYGLSQRLGIEEDAARNYLEKYHEAYPGVKKLREFLHKQAVESGGVMTIGGIFRPMPEIHGVRKESDIVDRAAYFKAERQLLNTLIQGSAADILRFAIVHCGEEIRKRFPGSRLLACVHDEIIAEVGEGDAEEAIVVVKEAMKAAVSDSLGNAPFPIGMPISVDVGHGKTWGTAKK